MQYVAWRNRSDRLSSNRDNELFAVLQCQNAAAVAGESGAQRTSVQREVHRRTQFRTLERNTICIRIAVGHLCDRPLAPADDALHERHRMSAYVWESGFILPYGENLKKTFKSSSINKFTLMIKH